MTSKGIHKRGYTYFLPAGVSSESYFNGIFLNSSGPWTDTGLPCGLRDLTGRILLSNIVLGKLIGVCDASGGGWVKVTEDDGRGTARGAGTGGALEGLSYSGGRLLLPVLTALSDSASTVKTKN